MKRWREKKGLFIGLLVLGLVMILWAPSAEAVTKGVIVGQSPSGEFFDLESGTNTTTIQVGDSVLWQWVTGPHTVTSRPETGPPIPGPCGTGDTFDSGPQGPGATFTHTFNTPGTCSYFCQIHGSLGQVIVKLPRPPRTTTTTTTTPTSSTTTTTTIAGPVDLAVRHVRVAHTAPVGGAKKVHAVIEDVAGRGGSGTITFKANGRVIFIGPFSVRPHASKQVMVKYTFSAADIPSVTFEACISDDSNSANNCGSDVTRVASPPRRSGPRHR